MTGELKKTVDLAPFSFDPTWNAHRRRVPGQRGRPRRSPTTSSSAAWAATSCTAARATTPSPAPRRWTTPTSRSTTPTATRSASSTSATTRRPGAPVQPIDLNPGNVLAFNPEDLDGKHLNNRFRAGEFALYDEYDPLRKILLTATGELWKPGDRACLNSCSISTRPKASSARPARCPSHRTADRDLPGGQRRRHATPSSATSATTGWSAAPAATTCTAAGATTC